MYLTHTNVQQNINTIINTVTIEILFHFRNHNNNNPRIKKINKIELKLNPHKYCLFKMSNTDQSVPKVLINKDKEDEFENVTVKFEISEEKTIAHTYLNSLTFQEVKTDIASKFKIDPKYIQFLHCGIGIRDEKRIYDICRNDFGILDVKLQLLPEAEFDNVRLDVNVYYRYVL